MAGEIAALDEDLAGDLGRRLAAVEAGIDALLAIAPGPAPLPVLPDPRVERLAEALAAMERRLALIEEAVATEDAPIEIEPLLAELDSIRATQADLAAGYAELAAALPAIAAALDALAAGPPPVAAAIETELSAIDARLARIEAAVEGPTEEPAVIDVAALAAELAALRDDYAAIASRQTEIELLFAELLSAQQEMLAELLRLRALATEAPQSPPANEAPPAESAAADPAVETPFGEELRLRLNGFVAELRRGLSPGG